MRRNLVKPASCTNAFILDSGSAIVPYALPSSTQADDDMLQSKETLYPKPATELSAKV